jgi:DNA-binding response OmpR family regulator
MPFPPNVTPFPDDAGARPALGTHHRALLSLLTQRPGHVVTPEQVAAKLKLPSVSPRRIDALVRGLNAVLGPDTVATVHRRGWKRSQIDAPFAAAS